MMCHFFVPFCCSSHRGVDLSGKPTGVVRFALARQASVDVVSGNARHVVNLFILSPRLAKAAVHVALVLFLRSVKSEFNAVFGSLPRFRLAGTFRKRGRMTVTRIGWKGRRKIVERLGRCGCRRRLDPWFRRTFVLGVRRS